MPVIGGRSLTARGATFASSLVSFISQSHVASPHRPLMARDADAAPTVSPLTDNLIFVLLALVLAASLAVGLLLLLRRYKRKQARRDSLPTYKEGDRSPQSRYRSQGAARETVDHVRQEKQRLMSDSEAPRDASPVPEIRITLPEEMDDSGKPQSGRVVVVHVGEETVGFAPCDNTLPSYQQSESDRFDSLDLDRIGGLKEKEHF